MRIFSEEKIGKMKGEHIMKNRLNKFVKPVVSLVAAFAVTLTGMAGLISWRTLSASAESFIDTSAGVTWTYTLSNGKAINVYTTDSKSGTLIIPENMKDGEGHSHPVASIGGGTNSTPVGKGCSGVALPSTIEAINPYAFSGLNTLQAISINGNSLQTVGNSAFENCTSLKSIKIGTVLSVGNNAFKGCTSLTSATLPACTSVGDSAFEGCSAMTAYKISSYATKIGSNAFKSCTKLAKAYIPDTVTSFGTGVFSGDTALTTVQLDAKLSYTKTFVNCTALKNIIFGEKVTEVAGDAFSYTAARPTTLTKSGAVNYYFLNPKTKINMGTSTDTQSRSGLLTNTPVTNNIKSTSFTGTIDGNIYDGSSNYPGATIITNNINSKQSTVKFDYTSTSKEDKTFTLTYQSSDSKDMTFSVSNDKETTTENVTSLLGNSVGVPKSSALDSVDASVSAIKYVFSGKTVTSSSSYGGSQEHPYPSGFYTTTLYHTINIKNNATKVTLTKTAASKTVPILADIMVRTVKDNYSCTSTSNGGYAPGTLLNNISDSTETLKSDLSLSPSITITGNFGSATFKNDWKSYAKNNGSGTADVNIYTKTGNFADKTEIQTSTYAYPETMDTNNATKVVATNNSQTAVNVKDISGATIPYVVEADSVKLTKISASYENAEAVGSSIDPSSVTIKCYYNDGSTKDIKGDTEGVSFDTTSVSAKGDNKFTVTYNSFSASFNVIGFEGKSLKAELNTTYLAGLDGNDTGWNAEKQAFKTNSVLTKEMITVKVISGGEGQETTNFDFVNNSNKITSIGDNEVVVQLTSDDTYKATVTVKGYNPKVEDVTKDDDPVEEGKDIFDVLADKISTLNQNVKDLQDEITNKDNQLTEKDGRIAECEKEIQEYIEQYNNLVKELSNISTGSETEDGYGYFGTKKDAETGEEVQVVWINGLELTYKKVVDENGTQLTYTGKDGNEYPLYATTGDIDKDGADEYCEFYVDADGAHIVVKGADKDSAEDVSDEDIVYRKTIKELERELTAQLTAIRSRLDSVQEEIENLKALLGIDDADWNNKTSEEQLKVINQKVRELLSQKEELERQLNNSSGNSGSSQDVAKYQSAINKIYKQLTSGNLDKNDVSDLQDNLTKILDEISKVQSDNKKLSEDNASYEKEVADLKEKIAALTGQLGNKDQTIKDLQNSIKDLQNTSDSLKETIANQKETIANLIKDTDGLNNTNDEMKNEITDLSGNFTSLEGKLSDLSKLLEDAQKKIDDGTATEDDLKAVISQANQIITELLSDNETQASIISQLKANITNLEKLNKDQSDAIASLKEKVSDLSTSNDNLQTSIDKLNKTIAGQSEEIEKLNKVIAGLDADIASYKSAIAERDATIAQLTSAAESYVLTVDDAAELFGTSKNASAKEVKASINAFVATKTENENTLRKIQQKLNTNATGDALVALVGKSGSTGNTGGNTGNTGSSDSGISATAYAALMSENNTLKSTNTTLSSENTTLKADKASLQKEVNTLSSDLKSEKSDNEDLQNTVSSLKKEKTTLETDNTTLTENNKTLQGKVNDLNTKNSSLTKKNATLTKENKSLTTTSKALAAKNKNLTSANKTLTTKNKALTKENGSLQTRLASASKSSNSYNSSYNSTPSNRSYNTSSNSTSTIKTTPAPKVTDDAIHETAKPEKTNLPSQSISTDEKGEALTTAIPEETPAIQDSEDDPLGDLDSSPEPSSTTTVDDSKKGSEDTNDVSPSDEKPKKNYGGIIVFAVVLVVGTVIALAVTRKKKEDVDLDE